MARISEIIFSILYIAFCIHHGYSQTESQDMPPQIVSEIETIIQANDNYTLFCQGSRPLKWTVPKVAENTWTTFITMDEAPIETNYTYGSRLYIFNMTYLFVGFYYCHYEDAGEIDKGRNASTYLYVNDSTHLAPVDEDMMIMSISATQYQRVVIPCKPTSPDIKVRLYVHESEEVEDANYDPKTGFSFYVSELSQQQLYTCTFTRNSESTDLYVYLNVNILPLSHLPTPDLKDLSGGHTIIGQPLKLECIIIKPSENEVMFHWTTPAGPPDQSRMEVSAPVPTTISSYNAYKQSLTVYNTTMEDKGVYICNVTDLQGHSAHGLLDVIIFDEDEFFLNLYEAHNLSKIIARAGDEFAQWVIRVEGHPVPTITWLNNNNEIIPIGNSTYYEASFNTKTSEAFLKIKDVSINKFGYYTLLATNNKMEKSLKLFLNVTDKPTVTFHGDKSFYMVNKAATLGCSAYGNPQPIFKLEHKECLTDDCDFMEIPASNVTNDGLVFTSEITFIASNPGYIKCSAKNYLGHDEGIATILLTDVENGFDIFGLDDTIDLNAEDLVATVAVGEEISLTCGASVYNYTDLHWFLNDKVLTGQDGYGISRSSTEYSHRIRLEIPRAEFSDSGEYRCGAINHGSAVFRNLTVNVTEAQVPSFRSTNLKDEIEINIPERVTMFCNAFGIPKPTITWHKDGESFDPLKSGRIITTEDNQNITFMSTEAEDEGTYTCEAKNREGLIAKKQKIIFKNLPKNPIWLWFIILFLSILSIAALVFLIVKIRKEKKLQRELKRMGLANFEKGAVENINPDLNIDDQAELLPYDRKWELPIENLKLGKQLGSGAFGVVMKGEAKRIVEGEEVTVVAVKMVKKNADDMYIKALASELKIMVHLGKHLNVVNLLGACTKNVAKRELLVIVEYCRFGNLQNYLLRHRELFINQLDPKTGKLDYLIGSDQMERTYSVSCDRSNTKSPSLKYAALAFSTSSNQPILPPANHMGDYRENANTATSGRTEMTTLPPDDGTTLSNNSIQPEWRSNYKGDYKGQVNPICTKDLLTWAFQVARGMEYLASRKVLHGDLAARNILLADNNVVKICDFGLAKSMYKDGNYKKRGDGPLPVKWMAIESIRDRVFSTQSDVWSFGIVLWEFFSLARTPYPGMAADEKLYQKLVEGYRMESPEYSPKQIYTLMIDCWATKPLARPSFAKLAESIGAFLEESVRKNYIDLNDPYLAMNCHRLEAGENDYLAMMSPPTFEALSSPHYMNEHALQNYSCESGYMSMKPDVFSPRLEEDKVFDFSVANRKHLNSEHRGVPELLPMLRLSESSESDTSLQAPVSPNSFSNPSYHIPPRITEEDETTNKTNIIKSTDNYVNIPQNKNVMKEKHSSNPFVNIDKSDYMNGDVGNWKAIEV